MRQTRDSYYDNLLEKANDPRLSAATKSTLEQCEQERLAGLVEAKPVACPTDVTNGSVEVPTEDGKLILTIKSVTSSFQIDRNRCLAAVAVEYPAGTIEDLEEAKDVPWMVKIERGVVTVLPAFNGPGVDLACGKIEIKHFAGAMFQVTGGLGYCHGGTAAWAYDSLWKGTTKLDEATIGLH